MASSETNNEHYSSFLPLDVISDILLLLPVKTLSRLKLVSKSWLSLISSPSFRSSHRRRSERNPLLLVATYEREGGHGTYRRNHFHALDYYKERGGGGGGGKALPDRETTCYYCNGVGFSCGLDLVCMSSCDEDIYIRNPATREQIALLKKYSGFRSTLHDGHAVAFAYLPSTGEYKVLRLLLLFSRFRRRPIRIEVFTLGSGRWRKKESPPLLGSRRAHRPSSSAKPSITCAGIFTCSWMLVICTDDDDDDPIARVRSQEGGMVEAAAAGVISRDSVDGTWALRLNADGADRLVHWGAGGDRGRHLWLLSEGRDSSCASWVKRVQASDHFCYPHDWFHVVDVEKDGERCWRVRRQAAGLQPSGRAS
ncbi:F-box/kelch-repeat protein At3g23880-like [Asparagus officinalis]|uniref:F-box/kelch-repeat protein At3g23880-like n=1 Tax=Asparagus officinalis TaxID=4686 RepID=UPI00098DF805|nr:F-box/kelch-repeat protein At3g23880-like [Asparagus officinalis]